MSSDQSVFGNRYFTFFKGRVALYAILKASGVKAEDEVIVPGFTCVAVPQAVRFAGARPVYVDVDERTFNLDPGHLASKVSGRTRAVIVQHTFGLPAEVTRIKAILGSRGIRIIEDCAHSMESRYDGRRVGTLGDAAFFSTQWSKPITTGVGGIAVASDPSIRSALEEIERGYVNPSFREWFALYVQLKIHQSFFKPSRYWLALNVLHGLSRIGLFVGSSEAGELVGTKPDRYEKRMGLFQARALGNAMGQLRQNSAHRQRVGELYADAVKQLGLRTIAIPEGAEPVLLRYPVLVSNKLKVLDEAKKRRVEIGDWFVSPVHPLTEGLERVGYRSGLCPVAESVARQVINLPTHPGVDDTTIGRTCEFLEDMKSRGHA